MYTFAFLPSLYCFDLCNSITGVECVDFRLKQIIVMMWMCQYLFSSKTSKKILIRRGTKHYNHDSYHKTCKEFLAHDFKITTYTISILVNRIHTITAYYSMICLYRLRREDIKR